MKKLTHVFLQLCIIIALLRIAESHNNHVAAFLEGHVLANTVVVASCIWLPSSKYLERGEVGQRT